MSSDDTLAPKPRKTLLSVLSALLGIAIFLLALLWMGQAMRERLAHLDRYTIAFSEIDCEPPPDQDRQDFLAEVQYLGALPDRLPLLDETLPSRLADAFARHSAVEKVLEVKVLPSRQVQVRLAYRLPRHKEELSKENKR
jgi:hypothetical protein